MTAPVSGATGAVARLAVVAGWDVPEVRGAVGTLAAVAGRLPVWRMRVGALARALHEAECWSGPAARAAAASVFEISTVAAAVDGAIEESLAAFERLAGEADTAQELAARALATTASLDGLPAALESSRRLGVLVGQLAPGAVAAPDPDPAHALAAEALEHAAAASAAVAAAAEPLARLAGIGGTSAAGFGGLVAETSFVGPVLPPRVPVGSDPEAVAAWWAALSAGAQLAVVRSSPGAVGALDGLPGWARDEANRVLLADALRDPGTSAPEAAAARAVAGRIAVEEAAGRPVQLHLLDLTGDRVVLTLGDLDTAEAVAVLVPGVGNSPADDLGRLVADAADVGAATRTAAPGLAVATTVWLGYRPPATVPAMVTRAAATAGGAALATGLAGLTAARASAGTGEPRTSVLAHSYGTVVVDEAADRPGRLAADAVVLLGSPGMEDDARSLEVAEVYDAAPAGDPVADFGWFGMDTRADAYGSTALSQEWWMGHSDYYDPGRPTLAAMGEVVAGVRTPG